MPKMKQTEIIDGYTVHKSHNAIDVSDVSLFYDLLCEHCHHHDENLATPCIGNPDWMVTI